MDTTLAIQDDAAAPCETCLRCSCHCTAAAGPSRDQSDPESVPAAEPYVWMPWSAGIAANA